MDDDIDDDLENADTTALLAGMYAELQRMRQIMEMDAFGTQLDIAPEAESENPTYGCDMCGEHVDPDNRLEHLKTSHNAPPNMTEAMIQEHYHTVDT